MTGNALSRRTSVFPLPTGKVDRQALSCSWCVLQRWWGGLTRCDRCGWEWDGKTDRRHDV